MKQPSAPGGKAIPNPEDLAPQVGHHLIPLSGGKGMLAEPSLAHQFLRSWAGLAAPALQLLEPAVGIDHSGVMVRVLEKPVPLPPPEAEEKIGGGQHGQSGDQPQPLKREGRSLGLFT